MNTTTTPDARPTSPKERRARARSLYERSLHEGEPLSGKDLGDAFGLSARWGRKILAEIRTSTDDRNGAGRNQSTEVGGAGPGQLPERAGTTGGTAAGTDGNPAAVPNGRPDPSPTTAGTSGTGPPPVSLVPDAGYQPATWHPYPTARAGQARSGDGRPDEIGGGDDPRALSGLILLAMAAAMAWSWQHLAHLADMSGAANGTLGIGNIAIPMAWLLPISVDVLLVAGAWKARRLHSHDRRAGTVTYLALIGAGLMSLGGNVLSTLDMADITPPIDHWNTPAAITVVVIVGLWMPTAAILGLEVLRDRGTTH